MKTGIAACLGASFTAAHGSYDWIRDVEQRPGNASLRFRRFAQGGDLAYNALQRLPEVIGCHPDNVIVLLGTNDVLALISKKWERLARFWKRLPRRPSPEWYRENMQAIVRRLKKDTSARIALCSLPPMGEDPASVSPFQAEANRRVAEYNAIIKEIAGAEGVSYLPVYERMHEELLVSPGPAYSDFKFLPLYRDAFRLLVLQKSLDEIGRRGGWRLHTDGIHLNSRGGKILADLVQEFISA